MYDAPELVLHPGPVDVGYALGADVWAFGCVVFEMVVGQPFVFASPHDRIFAKVARLGNPPTLAGVAPMQGVSSLACALTDRDPLLLHFLQKVLCWEPNSRPIIVDLCRSQ